MVNLEQLKTRGLRAYEAGRVRTALRIAYVLIPAAAVCLLEANGRPACVCASVSLLGLAIWMRWRDRRGTEAVTTGLLAGSVPLAAGLVLARLGFHCGSAGTAAFCTGVSALVGIGAGAFIAVQEVRRRARFWSALTAGTVATMAASLGCVRLGVVGVVSVAAGMAAGMVATAAIAKPSE
jgi:hypothetical protein